MWLQAGASKFQQLWYFKLCQWCEECSFGNADRVFEEYFGFHEKDFVSFYLALQSFQLGNGGKLNIFIITWSFFPKCPDKGSKKVIYKIDRHFMILAKALLSCQFGIVLFCFVNCFFLIRRQVPNFWLIPTL